MLTSSNQARHTWFESFRQTCIERDLRDMAQIAKLPEFSRLMSTLNLRTGQLLNAAVLSRDIGLPSTTLRRYFILERGDRLVGIEVKWSTTLDSRQLGALRHCRQTRPPRWQMGVLLHGGAEAIALDDRTAALPFSCALA